MSAALNYDLATASMEDSVLKNYGRSPLNIVVGHNQ